jgi:alkylation response protein AidB-like acyl-CoA dehydrogenase
VRPLEHILASDAAPYLESADKLARLELAPRILEWDAAPSGVATGVVTQLADLGLTEVLGLEELGTERERLALFLALTAVLAETGAGIAMAGVVAALTEHLFGQRTGVGVTVPGPAGVSTVVLAAGERKILVVGPEGGRFGMLAADPANLPLLGLRVGGAGVIHDALADGKDDPPSAQRVRAISRHLQFGAVASAIGSARGSLDAARAYADERYQGGALISSHHAVRALLDSMRDGVDHSEVLLSSLLSNPDAPEHLEWSCAARAFALCERAVVDGVQVLGGYGYMQEYGQEKRMRDVKTLRLLFLQE